MNGFAHRMPRVVAAATIAVVVASCDFFTAPKPEPTSIGPTIVAGGHTFTKLATGDGHSCGLTADGTAYCWGFNTTPRLSTGVVMATGQLGDSLQADRQAPALVAGGFDFTSITAGAFHTCALTAAGAAYCWGANRNEFLAGESNAVTTGQLGDGTTEHRFSPVAVTGGQTFAQISAGWYHTCALTSGGAAWCWGSGGLGVGDTVTRFTPTAVSGGLTFQSVSAGGTHTCAITAAGAAYCWGANFFGQLGDSTTSERLVPTLVVGGRTFQSIAASGNSTCGISSGSAYCWGDGTLGNVGDGTTFSRHSPTKASSSETLSGLTLGSLASSVFSGSAHACALNATGQARCWGNNNAGQLGDGTFVAQVAPKAVSTTLTFQTLVSGGLHTCGLTASGAAYCWGARQVVGGTP